MTDYVIKYQLHLHTYNKTIEDKLKVARGTRYFNEIEGMNCEVNSEKDAVSYIKNLHKVEGADKLFKVPQNVYDSEFGDIGASSLTVLRCYMG